MSLLSKGFCAFLCLCKQHFSNIKYNITETKNDTKHKDQQMFLFHRPIAGICYILMRHFLKLCSSWSPWWSRTASGSKTRSEQQLLGFKEREVEKKKANSDLTAAQLTVGGAVLSSTAIYT